MAVLLIISFLTAVYQLKSDSRVVDIYAGTDDSAGAVSASDDLNGHLSADVLPDEENADQNDESENCAVSDETENLYGEKNAFCRRGQQYYHVDLSPCARRQV